MTSNIVNVCNTLKQELENVDRDSIMNKCIRNKLLMIYQQNNKEFDTLLSRLEYGLNYNDVYQVKKCVTSLLRLLNSNKKSLISILGKVL